MTNTLQTGSRVRITNIMGRTAPLVGEAFFDLVGQEGFINLSHTDGWLSVLVPSHKEYSTGYGALLRPTEVEPF